ncbi:hypothetical protein L218DRAFT_563080 [Marasmius fiardii PR-910]|nr:hypothetical protein L218DRAFT_563080 [Marasmius fiardii PR-910]
MELLPVESMSQWYQHRISETRFSMIFQRFKGNRISSSNLKDAASQLLVCERPQAVTLVSAFDEDIYAIAYLRCCRGRLLQQLLEGDIRFYYLTYQGSVSTRWDTRLIPYTKAIGILRLRSLHTDEKIKGKVSAKAEDEYIRGGNDSRTYQPTNGGMHQSRAISAHGYT